MFFFYSIFRPTVDFCLDFSASCDGSDYYWRMPQMYFPLLNFIPRYGSDLDDIREFESMPQPSNQAKHQLYCDLTWLTGRQHVASSFFAPFCPILPISPNLPFLPPLNMSVGHQVRHISENYRIFPDLSTVNIFAGKYWFGRQACKKKQESARHGLRRCGLTDKPKSFSPELGIVLSSFAESKQRYQGLKKLL